MEGTRGGGGLLIFPLSEVCDRIKNAGYANGFIVVSPDGIFILSIIN